MNGLSMMTSVQPALRTLIEPFLLDPRQVRADSAPLLPLAFVDLAGCPGDAQIPLMPPFPLIGVGDGNHPLVPSLDALLEPPVTAESLLRQVQRTPNAAAIAVQLLRSLNGIACERALTLESLCYGMLQGSAEYAAWLAAREPTMPRSPAGSIIVQRSAGVLHVVIDRPAARNSIDAKLRDELFEAFTLAALDPDIHSVKLRAVGDVFSMGGDLEEFGTTRDPALAHMIRSRTLPAAALVRRREIYDVHVQGACVGAGLEMAAFASRLSASANAWFQLPELSMGLIPGAGGCVSVPRRIGRQRTALMILSGRRISAKTALHWGLVDAIEDLPPVNKSSADVSRG